MHDDAIRTLAWLALAGCVAYAAVRWRWVWEGVRDLVAPGDETRPP